MDRKGNPNRSEMEVEFDLTKYDDGSPCAMMTGWTPRGRDWVLANAPAAGPHGSVPYDAPFRGHVNPAFRGTNVITAVFDPTDFIAMTMKCRKDGLLVREWRAPCWRRNRPGSETIFGK
jgi:hypothetical protein